MTEFNSETPPGQPPQPPTNPHAYSQAAPGMPPVAALPYAMPMERRERPGILSAVAVISIVVACLSFIASLMSGCQAGSFYLASKMSQTAAGATTMTTTTTTSGGTTTFTTSASAGTGSIAVTPVAPASGTSPAAAAPATALTPAEVTSIVQKAQAATGNKLTTAQMTALTNTLSDPNQNLVAPGTAWSPVRSAIANPDGSAFITFTAGYVSLAANGVVTANANLMPKFNISGTVCILSGLDALLSVGLAIFLFVSGIIVMRQSPSGRRLHLTYAIVKIPLAILGGLAVGMLYSDFYGSVGATVPGAASTLRTVGMSYGIILAGIGLIYPIALLITFNAASVRGYYNAVR